MKSLKETKELEDNSFIIFIKKGYFKLALFCFGAVAQLGERLPCKQEVGGSIPPGSTSFIGVSPSGKALGFDPSIRRFESCHLSQFASLIRSDHEQQMGSV